MAEEINFLELACLLKVTNNTVLEKFGSAINSSIFDASNIAGTLKQNGLIDFTAYYPGPNEIVVTEEGKKLISEAETKSIEPFDKLDETILSQLSGGKKQPQEIQSEINIRPKDLALRLYKLNKQSYIIYELKSGTVDIMMTEAGFLKASTVSQKPAAAKPQPQAAAASAETQHSSPQMQATMKQQQDAPAPEPKPTETGKPQEQKRSVEDVLKEIRAGRQRSSNTVFAVVAIVVVIIAVVLYLHFV
jgi:hypothetical protein